MGRTGGGKGPIKIHQYPSDQKASEKNFFLHFFQEKEIFYVIHIFSFLAHIK